MRTEFKKVEDDTAQYLVEAAFNIHAPLTMALINAGLVYDITKQAQAAMTLETQGPKITGTKIINNVECPVFETHSIPLPFTYGDVNNKENHEEIRYIAAEVAKRVEKTVVDAFRMCRIIVGMEPQLAIPKDHPNTALGAKVVTIMVPQVRTLE